jgi:hypothetical protein
MAIRGCFGGINRVIYKNNAQYNTINYNTIQYNTIQIKTIQYSLLNIKHFAMFLAYKVYIYKVNMVYIRGYIIINDY